MPNLLRRNPFSRRAAVGKPGFSPARQAGLALLTLVLLAGLARLLFPARPGAGGGGTTSIPSDGSDPNAYPPVFSAGRGANGEPEVKLLAVGDLMLARGVDSMIGKHGLGYPLELVASRMADADLTLANLESPLGTRGHPLPRKGIWFRARPEAVRILRQGGVDLVTLANNHILDYDTDNFLETLDLLRQNGVAYFGGGRNLEEARRPLVLRRKGLRIAFLGYSQFADLVFSWSYPRPFRAADDRPGIAPMQDDLVLQDIARARREADVVVVAYHWGDEYQNLPTPDQVRLGRASIDAGASVVLGFHPHAIQGLERYKGGLIAYSLGNFVMDQYDPVTLESMIVEMRLTRQGVVDVQVTPVRIEGWRPRILEGQEREWLGKKIARLSEQIGR